MCTVILAHRLFDQAPILFGANRDEQLARPSQPPALRRDGPIAAISPRDLQAGGTWLGLNARGVLVAITNRFGRPADPTRRSRGELVDRALAHPSAANAAVAIAALPADDYNAFHLLCVDEDQAHLVWSDGALMSQSHLEPGITVITERSLGAADNRRKQHVLRECRSLLAAGDLDEAHLEDVLSRRDDGSIDATCVDIPEFGYGTRSSTIVRLGERPRLLHCEGPPCANDYDDMTDMLARLLGAK